MYAAFFLLSSARSDKERVWSCALECWEDRLLTVRLYGTVYVVSRYIGI